MKIKIETIYENVDENWLKWWLENRTPAKEIKKDLERHSFAVFESKDPMSEVFGITKFEIIKD